MLNQCASCTRCKKKALHEAMRSAGRVGVRAARAKAACLLASVLQAASARDFLNACLLASYGL